MSTPSPAAPTPPLNLPLSASIFDGFDWDAPPVTARMLVELPFRLMCADATYDVTVGGCTIAIEVLGSLVETTADRTVVGITPGDGSASAHSWVMIQQAKTPAEVRAMRTTFAFAVQVTPGTLRGFAKRCGETINAHRYVRALLDGHIEHINLLINCYRVAAGDPFPFEVTAWDLSGVYLQMDQAWYARVNLIPYLEHNETPVLLTPKGGSPVVYATPDDVRKRLAEPLRPGQVDLQDGWAHFVRGRFADAITSFVTAIEVALEAAIERALTEQGVAEPDRRARLEKTFNNFDARFSDYLRIAKRAAPAPYVHIVPYIHGLRLREEFGDTRKLRHKVVHEGMRLSSTLRGPALRVAETTTWLFDWISPSHVKWPRRNNHPTKLTLAGVFLVKAERTAAGIRVVDPRVERVEGPIYGVDTARFNRLPGCIAGEEQDLQLFFETALTLLKLRARHRPAEPAHPGRLTHAYDIDATGAPALALLADLDGLLNLATIDAATGVLFEESRTRGNIVKGLLVVNHQRHMSIHDRERVNPAAPDVVAAAARRGLAILTTADFYDLLLISRGKQTRYDAIRAMLQELVPGRVGAHHPAYRPVGTVRHYYPKVNALSVDLNPVEPLTIGQTLAIRLAEGFREFGCTELQVERAPVQQAPPGVRVGIRFETRRNEVELGETLYVVQDALVAVALKPDAPPEPAAPIVPG